MDKRKFNVGMQKKYLNYNGILGEVLRASDKTEKNGAVLYVIKCSKCGEEHLRNAKHLKQGIFPRKHCAMVRAHNYRGIDRWDGIIRRTYGITLAEYDEKVAEQGGVCAICGKVDVVKGRRLAIDHCHKTKKVRGALCSHCNQGLGSYFDSPELLCKAAAYLIKYSNAR